MKCLHDNNHPRNTHFVGSFEVVRPEQYESGDKQRILKVVDRTPVRDGNVERMKTPTRPDSPVATPSTRFLGRRMALRSQPSREASFFQTPPPSPGPKNQELVKQVHAVLADLKTYHPAYDPAAGYEMAGFFWFQGFNDKSSDKPTRYKEHMANFIRDIRSEFKAPAMPIVIGVLGTGSWAKKTDYSTLSHAAAAELGKKETAGQPVAVAQREAAALPEFAGTVVAVESYPYYDYAILPLYEVYGPLERMAECRQRTALPLPRQRPLLHPPRPCLRRGHGRPAEKALNTRTQPHHQ